MHPSNLCSPPPYAAAVAERVAVLQRLAQPGRRPGLPDVLHRALLRPQHLKERPGAQALFCLPQMRPGLAKAPHRAVLCVCVCVCA